ncbi:MAG: undecaprenyl-diphosphatase [Candidatus Pacebacteria bacterium]|nr:undecaprenyl-diphosphatase [Candidatus Paceibacterota bacterium]
MPLNQAIFLGVVQGLTEFLPVSSSGHLVLFQNLFGWQQANLAFDVWLHLATVLAIMVFFWSDLKEIQLTEIKAILIGSIPAFLAGWFFHTQLNDWFHSIQVVVISLIITGLFNFYIDANIEKSKVHTSEPVSEPNGFIIGIFQALAIIPGISRSGATVAGGVYRGLERINAFRFSFLLAIPAILGASSLQLWNLNQTGFAQVEPVPFAAGAAAAFVVGLLSLKLFHYVIKTAKMEWFGWYCVVLGGVGALLISISIN